MTPSDTDAGTETVLVTGGTGFIGSHLALRLVDDGHEVVAVDAAPDAALLDRLGVAESVEVRRGDVTDVAAIARAIRESGATRIVHLAALLSEDVRTDELATTRVNVLGANHVLEAARLFSDRIDRVVVTSSETVYGPGSAYEGPVPEDALLSPDSPYAAAKRHAECLSRRYREDHGVPAVVLRPTGVFGPFRRSFTAFSDLFERPAVGDPVRVEGGGTAVSWLSVRDAADAFRRAALASDGDLEHGVYNVRGEVATVAETAEAVRRLLPGAAVTVADDADHDWSAQRLALDRARTDLGYEIDYGLEELTREYVDAVRRDAGLGTVD
ncbi:NAD-dependent epimerase/dehydratase family protein [Halorubrum cibi]|uniref:Nucleoside-diphosphate-sugar epimerase n=1 Tax=Halorubrum cibi TaxID=413815 RepID=A0A521CPY1_9EURY|nr:NAD(P)-dependent oxidoreductase [Halorubrum cibi]SMO61425.1 Nucleoside-diphosphate-sugar epimerase [Halorubrum cibi]